MSEADVLRRAAALMRERAEAATPGRWVVFDMDDGLSADERVNDVDGWWWVWAEDRLPNYGGVLDPDPHSANCTNRPETCCRVAVGTAGITDGSEPAKERADAEHIASWHPDMALMVANQLDAMADLIDKVAGEPLPVALRGVAAKSFAVARMYLGEQS